MSFNDNLRTIRSATREGEITPALIANTIEGGVDACASQGAFEDLQLEVATMKETIEGQNLHYDAANRKIILKSYYEDAEVASVELPLATLNAPGLMSADDKIKLLEISSSQTDGKFEFYDFDFAGEENEVIDSLFVGKLGLCHIDGSGGGIFCAAVASEGAVCSIAKLTDFSDAIGLVNDGLHIEMDGASGYWSFKTDRLWRVKDGRFAGIYQVAETGSTFTKVANLLTDSERTAVAAIPSVQPAWAGGTDRNYIYSDSTNGNLQVMTSNTEFLYVSNQASFTKLCFRKYYWAPEGNKYGTVAIPEAGTYTYSSQGGTKMRNGLMSVADKTKLDALPDAIAISSSIGARDNIYSYDETNPNGKRAVQGSLLFALTAESTEAEIKAALTEFSTKNVLNFADLNYAATHGAMLYDQNTQAYVQVTHNGGGFFNFLELSTAGWNELPKLRYVSIRITEDGTTWEVKRAGNSDRLVTLTEFGSMMQTIVDQMGALDERLTALES